MNKSMPNNKKSNKKTITYKIKTKYFFNKVIYDSFAQLGVVLYKEGLLNYKNNTKEDLSRILSTLVLNAKKNKRPFILLKDRYVFFADYIVSYKSTIKINEEPINKSVENLYADYKKVMNTIIGDIKVIDLLLSNKSLFYKFNGFYFKSEHNLKPYAYDRTIDKATMMALLNDSKYTLLSKKTIFYLAKTTKNKFYVKNNYIFLNRGDYINKFIIALTKEEVLKELDLIY